MNYRQKKYISGTTVHNSY